MPAPPECAHHGYVDPRPRDARVRPLPDPEDQAEVVGRSAEVAEKDTGALLEVGVCSEHRRDEGQGLLEGVGVVAARELDELHHLGRGLGAHVLYDALGEEGVGDRESPAVQRLELGGPEPDLAYPALEAADLDPVPDPEWRVDEDRHAAKEVRDGLLGSEGEGEASYPEARHDGAHVVARVVYRCHAAYEPDKDPRDVPEYGEELVIELGLAPCHRGHDVLGDDVVKEAGNCPGDVEDDDEGDDPGEYAIRRRRQDKPPLRPEETAYHDARSQGLLEHVDNEVRKTAFRPVSEALDAFRRDEVEEPGRNNAPRQYHKGHKPRPQSVFPHLRPEKTVLHDSLLVARLRGPYHLFTKRAGLATRYTGSLNAPAPQTLHPGHPWPAAH